MSRPLIDALESRQLLAATLTSARLDADTRKVILVGSADADIVEIARFGKRQAQVVDGGDVVLTFNLADAQLVSFSGLAGADYLSMGRTPLRLYAEGGDGADALSGSHAGLFADTLIGGGGDDYLFGGTGNDTLDGGGGGDQLLGNDGNDVMLVLSDSTTDDSVQGGLGIDTVDCTDYNRGVTFRIGDRSPGPLAVDDRIYGEVENILATGFADNITIVSDENVAVDLGRGNDTFVGGSGDDTVIGGRGDDNIRTLGGRDTLIDRAGANSLNGGNGQDRAYVSGNLLSVLNIEHVYDESVPNPTV